MMRVSEESREENYAENARRAQNKIEFLQRRTFFSEVNHSHLCLEIDHRNSNFKKI